MKVGDLVRHPGSVAYTGKYAAGIILRWNGKCGVMVLWDHGEICYSPLYELEVISESR